MTDKDVKMRRWVWGGLAASTITILLCIGWLIVQAVQWIGGRDAKKRM